MGKKLVGLFFTLIILISLSGVYVVGGLQAYARYQQESSATQNYCGGQLVHICIHTPRTIFSAFYRSTVAAQSPLFKVDYSSDTPRTLLIMVSIASFSQQQVQTVDATTSMQSRSFIPPVQDQALFNLTSDTNSALTVRVTDMGGRLYYQQDAPLKLYSRWLMQWNVANRLKIAAWVTPDDQTVLNLVTSAFVHLREQAPPVPSGMLGYGAASPQQVVDQVDALYDALRLDYHIHYTQADVPYSAIGDQNDQLIRLPAEVLQQHTGMCIELTNLLASAVERIGLHAEIVIIPGHAFLGVATAQDNRHFEYWDAVGVNDNVAGDSANVQTDALYRLHLQNHSIVDTILVSDARHLHINPML